MDLRKVKKLIELLESSALMEMEITEGDSTIRLSRAAPPVGMPVQHFPATSHVVSDQVATNQATNQTGAQQDSAQPSVAEASGNTIMSPLVGTFYESASPDSAPYVSVGSVVELGDVLCIIEAMKTFNQLEADIAGTVKAIYKSSGDPVEFGEPLFLIG